MCVGCREALGWGWELGRGRQRWEVEPQAQGSRSRRGGGGEEQRSRTKHPEPNLGGAGGEQGRVASPQGPQGMVASRGGGRPFAIRREPRFLMPQGSGRWARG